MKAYEVIFGYWDEVIMVVLADSEQEVEELIKDTRGETVSISELPVSLKKPGIIFRYDR